MSDPNMAEFYKRASRLETQRANGKGFESPGTLGRSYYHRPARKRRSVLWPVLLLLALGMLMKGAIYFATGPEVYNSRVADLRASTGVVEQAGGFIMQLDPVTQRLAGEIALGVHKITK